MNSSQIVVTCPNRIAPVLRGEAEALGYTVMEEMPAGIILEGTLDDAMRLNLWLRTGYRVLYRLEEFAARTPHDLYSRASRIPWEEYIDPDGYLTVISVVDTPAIDNSQFANQKLKDAVVDRIRSKFGRRPDSGAEPRGVVLFLRWIDNECAVFLDTSGEPLTRRGYRKIPYKAPMQESLAAATILSTVWRGEGAFVNPMCGSGTIAIEAALVGSGRAPGLVRQNFSFMHLVGFRKEGWEEMKRQAKARAGKLGSPIIATDHAPDAIVAARKNAVAAGVDHMIEFHVCDFYDTPLPEPPGVVMLNPEYGERLGDAELLGETYRRIGDFFKQKCSGYTGYIFTGNLDLAKQVGLRTKRRIPFFNASIDCRLLEYELYQGTRKVES